jgi:subtilisin family serine protease
MRVTGPILAIACLLPMAASAQGRLGAIPVPQIPTAVTHVPQAPSVPRIPTVPTVPSAIVTPPTAAIPPAAAFHLPNIPPAAALSAIAHGPAAAALEHAAADAAFQSSAAAPRRDDARVLRRAGLAKAAPEVFEIDRKGELVLRGRVLATKASERVLADAQRLGFEVVEHRRLASLGLDLAVLRVPAAMAVDDALAQLRAADPKGSFEADPVYETAGSAQSSPMLPRAKAGRGGKPVDIGLVDTGVAAGHPSLSGSRIVQQGFAAGGPTPGEHGTAVASLISGEAAGYRGVAPHSTLFVADVYGSGPGGGSASAVAKAIDWLVQNRTPVINISLVGPANRLLEQAIDAAVNKGVVVVAAVGNDGPFSPPLYPAAYRNVVAVTGVDRRDAILAEAVRSTPVAFAAPGADNVAARLGGGFEDVRGTSFAAPIVAAEIALDHRKLDRRDAVRALGQIQRKAVKAGSVKSATAYGWGLIGVDLRPGLSRAAGGALADLDEN